MITKIFFVNEAVSCLLAQTATVARLLDASKVECHMSKVRF
jgi:hypothetical protein